MQELPARGQTLKSLRSAGVLAALLGALAVGSLGSSCAHPEPVLRYEMAEHDLSLMSVGPIPWRPSDGRNQVVLVMMMTTWCFPCLTDLVVIDKLQKEFGPKGFQAVLVVLDLEGAKVVEPFARLHDPPMRVLVGSDAIRSGNSFFGTQRELPTRFLFDRKGGLVIAYGGVAAPEDLIEAVRREVEKN